MTRDELAQIVDRHIAQLMEHCDSVQILVTRYDGEENDTLGVASGKGNWFARVGQCQHFLVAAETLTAEATAGEIDDDSEAEAE